MNRNGKIARLPHEIREELNRRLDDNETGTSLLPWLNGLPAVKEILARQFGGGAISKQNLCQWRNGGFAEWQTRREILAPGGDLVADTKELAEAAGNQLTDHLSNILAAQYASVLTRWTGEVDGKLERKLRVLHRLTRDITGLRRGDHDVVRMKMGQDRREPKPKESDQDLFAVFKALTKDQNEPTGRKFQRRSAETPLRVAAERVTVAAPRQSAAFSGNSNPPAQPQITKAVAPAVEPAKLNPKAPLAGGTTSPAHPKTVAGQTQSKSVKPQTTTPGTVIFWTAPMERRGVGAFKAETKPQTQANSDVPESGAAPTEAGLTPHSKTVTGQTRSKPVKALKTILAHSRDRRPCRLRPELPLDIPGRTKQIGPGDRHKVLRT